MTVRTRATVAMILGAVLMVGCRQTPRSEPAPAQASSVAAPAGNPVQREMRLLHEGLRDTVTALANGTLETIPARLEQVDSARRATEQAVESGEYRLPKNAGDLPTFEQLDDRFHAELENLAAKARSNDAQATGIQLGVVLSQCGACHTRFRP